MLPEGFNHDAGYNMASWGGHPAIYFPTTDTLYLELDHRTFEAIPADEEISLEELKNILAPDQFMRYLHELNHRFLGQMSIVRDHLLIKNSIINNTFIFDLVGQWKENNGELDPSPLVNLRFQWLTIKKQLQAWRPVQESFAEILEAGLSAELYPYQIDPSRYLDEKLKKINEDYRRKSQKLMIETVILSEPSDENVNDAFVQLADRLQTLNEVYQQEALNAARRLFVVLGNDGAFSFIKKAAEISSRPDEKDDVNLARWTDRTAIHFLEILKAGSAIAEYLPSARGLSRAGSPSQAALHLSHALGFPPPMPDEYIRELRDSLYDFNMIKLPDEWDQDDLHDRTKGENDPILVEGVDKSAPTRRRVENALDDVRKSQSPIHILIQDANTSMMRYQSFKSFPFEIHTATKALPFDSTLAWSFLESIEKNRDKISKMEYIDTIRNNLGDEYVDASIEIFNYLKQENEIEEIKQHSNELFEGVFRSD